MKTAMWGSSSSLHIVSLSFFALQTTESAQDSAPVNLQLWTVKAKKTVNNKVLPGVSEGDEPKGLRRDENTRVHTRVVTKNSQGTCTGPHEFTGDSSLAFFHVQGSG
jgi:hypothetical protein